MSWTRGISSILPRNAHKHLLVTCNGIGIPSQYKISSFHCIKCCRSFSVSTPFFDHLIKELRKASSLSDLRRLITNSKDTKDNLTFVGDLSMTNHIYVLRIIQNSTRSLPNLYKNSKCAQSELEDSLYCYSLIWNILNSLENQPIKRTVHRGKHIVGVMWYLIKILNTCVVNPSDYQNLSLNHPRDLIDLSNLDSKTLGSVKIQKEDLVLISLRIQGMITLAILKLLRNFESGLVNVNGLDLQQIVMMQCEPSMVTNFNLDTYSGTDLIQNILIDNCKCIDELKNAITKLAIKHSNLFTDEQLVNTFASCFRKANTSLQNALITKINESSKKGFLDIDIKDVIQLMIASKYHSELAPTIKVLVTQLEYCSPPDGNVSPNHRRKGPGGPKWQQWLKTATLEHLGKLCKSLFILNPNQRTLGNVNVTFERILDEWLQRKNYLSSSPPPCTDELIWISHALHLFAKMGKRHFKSIPKALELIKGAKWEDNITSQDALYDLFWSVCNLKVDFDFISSLLLKIAPNIHKVALKWNVKLIAGLSSYTSGMMDFKKDPSVHYLVSKNNNTRHDFCKRINELIEKLQKSQKPCMERIITLAIEAIKIDTLERIEEFDNIQCISNFMFYIASTIDDFSLEDYGNLSDKWIKIADACKPNVKLEAIAQTMWSLQKNRIYHETILLYIRDMLKTAIPSATSGQLGLTSYALAYFNLFHGDIVDYYIKRLEQLVNSRHLYDNIDQGCLKFISTIWALVIGDFSLDPKTLQMIVSLLPKLNWEGFQRECKAADLQRVLQIAESLKTFGNIRENDIQIPPKVLEAAMASSRTFRDSGMHSVSQDKVRRVLERFKVNFRGEYQISSLLVDFCCSLDDNLERFEPHLVIEVDGPYHYAIVCGACTIGKEHHPVLVGNLRLIPNGKTRYRNRCV
ncbi:hypothetical protein BdWA1_000323 [Babesia duncani]|uniref:RAP domain-containing protein n=1 Tax=Babesia duncani TaxID=323732 RepID=A0AAD9PM04_9APIC|nr:hypothetical protein BdWA1_000323 [Babesia duncani]